MSPALLGSRLFHWGHYETEKEGGETDLVPEPLTGHTRHRVGAPVHENPNLFQLGHQDDRRTRQCKLCTAEGRFCALEVQLTKSLKVQGVPHSIKKKAPLTFAESYQGGRGRESILGQSGVYWQDAKGKTNTWNQHKCLRHVSSRTAFYQYHAHFWPHSPRIRQRHLQFDLFVCLDDKILFHHGDSFSAGR